eukprot:TRINITY_DN41293_c0_g1_i1.p1 TRINITY_DN41293_c0_g1~~TRINITY_DN41293_c0_g1_i1.p1  ORF type:complete len:246 (-),score=41.29 TRINITY_DN41293_c0_g1_i1:93-830(-)
MHAHARCKLSTRHGDSLMNDEDADWVVVEPAEPAEPPDSWILEDSKENSSGVVMQMVDAVEHFPPIGFLVSARHRFSGDHAEAKRAAARCTKGLVASGLGAGAAVATLGSGCSIAVMAGVAGGAIGSIAGHLAQVGIERTYSGYDLMKVGQEASEKPAREVLVESVVSGAACGMGCAVAGSAAEASYLIRRLGDSFNRRALSNLMADSSACKIIESAAKQSVTSIASVPVQVGIRKAVEHTIGRD